MIIEFLIILLIGVLQFLTAWLPTGPDSVGITLPWGLDDLLINAMSYFRAFIEIFPPAGVVLQAFIIYLGFKLGLMILKLFLGARSPQIQ